MNRQLHLEKVSKGFFARNFFGGKRADSYKAAIQDFSLEIDEGEIVALVGKNGVGKTTALKVAMGMYLPEGGKASLDGKPAHLCHRAVLGVMLGHRLLYPSLTGFENLAYTAALYRLKNIQKTIKDTSALWELTTFLDRPVEEYSQGMKTRLALARATMTSPRFLFLDEPFAFLDDQTAISMAAKVLRSMRTTTLITTPQAGHVGFADRVLEILAT